MNGAVQSARQDDLMPLQALAVASIPWTDEVTALATLGLAVLTFLLVIAAMIAAALTKRSIDVQLKAAAEDLQATREATRVAQSAAERQIEASHRPLLIEVAPEGPIYPDMGAWRPKTLTRDGLVPTGPEVVELEFAGGSLREDRPSRCVRRARRWANLYRRAPP